MRLLLDTQYIIWLFHDIARVTDAERRVLEAPESTIHVSAVSFWEINLKSSLLHLSGDRKLNVDAENTLTLAHSAGWNVLPLSARHATAILREPLSHRDPFDQMLMVQAQEEGLRLLTRDKKLQSHPIAFSA